MKKIDNENYFIIHHWMVSELNLKGSELIVFALIYSYCMSYGNFAGSQSYISHRTGITKPTVIKALKQLVEKQYIIRKTVHSNHSEFGLNFNQMMVKKSSTAIKYYLPEWLMNFNETGKEALHKNKDNKENKEENNDTIVGDVDYFTNYDWSKKW